MRSSGLRQRAATGRSSAGNCVFYRPILSRRRTGGAYAIRKAAGIVHDDDSQRGLAVAQREFMMRIVRGGETRTRKRLLGDDEFALVFLGQCFKAARGIDRVADGGQVARAGVTHLAYHDRAYVDADPYTQGRFQFATSTDTSRPACVTPRSASTGNNTAAVNNIGKNFAYHERIRSQK